MKINHRCLTLGLHLNCSLWSKSEFRSVSVGGERKTGDPGNKTLVSKDRNQREFCKRS